FSDRRRHTRSKRDWSSDVCSSDLPTFRGTVQAISQKYGIPAKLIHTTLSEMISKGLVIQKEQTSPEGRTVCIISGNWKELSKEEIGRASCRESRLAEKSVVECIRV